MTISVEPSLGWPYRPARTLVALDGALVSSSAIPVAAGWHTASVLTDVTVQCSVFSSRRATIRVRTSESFVVGEAPVAARLRIFADSDASRAHDERIHARWTIGGGSSEPPEATIEMKDTCGAELPEAAPQAPDDPIRLLVPPMTLPPVK